MQVETFLMERMQSSWENRVTYNLSESGVHALRLDEVLPGSGLGNPRLGYGHTNGSPELQERIAAMYAGASVDNVLVAVGTAEANFLVTWRCAGPDHHVVFMTPNYMQIHGVARALGSAVTTLPLQVDEGRWRPDLDALIRAVTNRTRLIAVCNPNNPTGAVLSETEMDEVCRVADRYGAWVLADEVYRGAELVGDETPTFWGRGERVLVTAGLSKAYGLPGLRLGWVVGGATEIADLLRYKDYTTIGPSVLSDLLAREALDPGNRERLLAGNRRLLRKQYRAIGEWLAPRRHLLEHIPPRAGAFVFLRYHADVNSTQLARQLRERDSVLLVPGDHFDMDGYLRIGFSTQPETLAKGLAALEAALTAASTPGVVG